jgi:mRNA interferase MazF
VPIDAPRRGELFYADLDPAVGHEQSGQRPFLILSVGQLNESDWEIVIGVPLTTTDRGSQMHVRIEPMESGLPRVSYAMPEMVRTISIQRLGRRAGEVPLEIADLAARRTGVLLGLGRTRR